MTQFEVGKLLPEQRLKQANDHDAHVYPCEETRRLVEKAQRLGIVGENSLVSLPELDIVAKACAKASKESLKIQHYAEAIQYVYDTKHYDKNSVFEFLHWLASQPVITDKKSEFGMLPMRASEICQHLSEN